MIRKIRTILGLAPVLAIYATVALVIGSAQTASALTPLPVPATEPGSHGLEATKTQPPPTQGATITTPGNGASFANSPITVSGICPAGLLVQLYNNGVMVGSVMCEGGSFRLEISLFAGVNELMALVFDDLEQAGPESNIVTVNYTDTSFSAFGELMTLTSSYGRRSTAAGNQLDWPLQLSGGTGPYAFSIDWGDNSGSKLMSQTFPGLVSVDHIYKRAGIYQVNIRATDVNGVSAFLQVIAVSSGQVDAAAASSDDSSASKTIVLWMPAAATMGLLLPAFWLGRRSQLVSLRNKMVKERDSYQGK